MPKTFELLACIGSPNTQVWPSLEMSVPERKEEVYAGKDFYNQVNHGIRHMEIFELGINRIVIHLRLQNELKVPTGRDLLHFSRFLHHEKKWSRFSTEKNKLFRLIQPAKEIIPTNNAENNLPNEPTHTPDGSFSTLSQEETISALKALFLTQDFGRSFEKKKDIQVIQELLSKWI